MFKSIWKILGFLTVFSAGNGAEETQDVKFENNALERLQELRREEILPCDYEEILTPIAEASKEDDANKRFPNLMAFIKDNKSAKDSLGNVYWSQKASEQFLYVLEDADEDKRKELLTEFIKGKVQYSEYQRSVITEGINSSSELRAIFEESTKYVEKDLNCLKKLQDLNDKMIAASSQNEKEEAIEKFAQIKENILEEAELSITWQYISENRDYPFSKILQTEKKNRDADHKVLASLKLLRQNNRVTSAESRNILASVANDELSNNGSCAIFTETRKFISEDDFLRQAFDTIKEDLKSPKSDNAEDILEKEAQSKENSNLDRNVLTLLKRLKRNNTATHPQSISILESVANDELSNGSCAIFIKTKKFISENNSLRQAFDAIKKDLNLLQIVKSLDSNNAGDIQKFEQMIEKILEKEAQLSKTLEYLSEDGDSPFWSMLQSQGQNKHIDRGTLELLKCLKRDNKAASNKSVNILESVANDELFNGSCAIYKETKEFINKDDFLRQAFDTISTELSKVQVKENSLAHSNSL